MVEREQLEWEEKKRQGAQELQPSLLIQLPVEMKEERKVLKKFFAGRREELQMSREAMSESLGHRLRQPDERGKKHSFFIFTAT
ncbi:hypothetical protein Taro_007270 [Colocasia esculenta]|uniref:Uncharacterized protein n=1 Tax=Colocasia esculenta TaxID=4460 RepID=A0A843TV10_COLES|nr:hypothetical protein [Colocasia esculenta]